MCKINDINNTKKYIKLSTTVTKALMHNDVLSRRACSLWFVIYSLSYHRPSKSISIYQHELANHLGVNLRTVSRCVRELVGTGFLNVNPLDKNDIYCINIYECTLPDWLVKEVDEEENVHINTQDVKIDAKNAKNAFSPKDMGGESLLEIGGSQNDGEDTDNSNKQVDVHNRVEPYKESYSQAEQEVSIAPSEENVVQKDINFINIKTQCMDCEYLQNEIKELERKLEKDMASFHSKPTFETLQVKNRTESELLKVKMEISRLQKGHQESIEQQKRTMIYQEIMQQMKIDPKLMTSKVGKREISGGLWWWINKKLHSFGVRSEKMALTINEIIFSVRFGSLSTLKFSTDEMPLMRSINIALKLVKERRWQTPANFYSKVESLCAI